jgi:hypothetical protein
VSNSVVARLQTEGVKARFMEADLGADKATESEIARSLRMAKPLKVVHKILI